MRKKLCRIAVGIDPTIASVARRMHINFSQVLELSLCRQLGLKKQIIQDISHQNRFDGNYPLPSQHSQREIIVVRSTYREQEPMPLHSGGRFTNLHA